MPIVTLPAPGNVPTGPGPVLNNQQLPRIDTRGEQQALERLGGAMAMPMMDKSAALPYEALGAVGKAISETGSILAAYSKKKTDAESEIQVATVDNKLKIAWAKEEEWQRLNPDTTTWEDHWQQTYAPLKGEVSGMKNLHPQAQAAIKLRLIDYEGDKAAQLVSKGGTTAFNQVAALRSGEVRTLIRDGKFDEAKQKAGQSVQDGYALPDFPTRVDDEIESKRKADVIEAERNDQNHVAELLADTKGDGPFIALDALKANDPNDESKSSAFPNLDAVTRLNMISQAESAVKKLQEDLIHGDGGIVDRIIEPNRPMSDNEIQENGEALRLPQNEINKLKDFRKSFLDSNVKDNDFNQTTATSLFNRIEDYDPINGSLEGWAILVQQTQLMGEKGDKAAGLTKSVLMQKLYLKHPYGQQKTISKDIPKDLSRLLFAELDAFKDAGSFGLTEINVQKTEPDAKGVDVPVPGDYVKKKNPQIAIKYIRASIALEKELAIEIQKNPGLADDPAAFSAWVQQRLLVTKTGNSVDLNKLPSATAPTGLFPQYPAANEFTNPYGLNAK